MSVIHFVHKYFKLRDAWKALVTCDLARQGHNEEQRSIKVSTYGIMFFGTPHAGANGVEFQTLLNNIGQIFVPGNSRILRLLNRDSDHLCYLTTLYSAINSDFKTICFFEEYNTPLFMGASVMVGCFWLLHASSSQYQCLDCSKSLSSDLRGG
jgi:hypothetical protein